MASYLEHSFIWQRSIWRLQTLYLHTTWIYLSSPNRGSDRRPMLPYVAHRPLASLSLIDKGPEPWMTPGRACHLPSRHAQHQKDQPLIASNRIRSLCSHRLEPPGTSGGPCTLPVGIYSTNTGPSHLQIPDEPKMARAALRRRAVDGKFAVA